MSWNVFELRLLGRHWMGSIGLVPVNLPSWLKRKIKWTFSLLRESSRSSFQLTKESRYWYSPWKWKKKDVQCKSECDDNGWLIHEFRIFPGRKSANKWLTPMLSPMWFYSPERPLTDDRPRRWLSTTTWKSPLPLITIRIRAPLKRREVAAVHSWTDLNADECRGFNDELFLFVWSAVYVQSNTLMGDYHHPRGIVVTHIVKANIPVRNGVVHLINKPLVVVDKEIVNFLKVIATL